MSTDHERIGPNLYDWAKERFALLKESADKAEAGFNGDLETERQFRLTLEKSLLEKFSDTEKLYDVIREMSDRASDKAEKAQGSINIAQNEWRTTFQEYTKLTVLRPEFDKLSNEMAAVRLDMEKKFSAQSGFSVSRPEFDKQAGDLAAVRLDMEKKFSAQSGEKSGARETKDDSKAMWAMAVSVATFAVMLLVEIFKAVKP